MTLKEQAYSTPEGRKLYRRKELILEITELMVKVMDEQGITQTALAQRVGKSDAHISRILRGINSPTLRTISDIFDALDVSISVLVKQEEASKWLSS